MFPSSVFRQIVDNLNDAILLIEDDDRLVYANQAATTLLALPGNYAGRRLSELVRPSVAGTLSQMLQLAEVEGESEIRLSDDGQIWIEFRRDQLRTDRSLLNQLTLKNIHRLKQTVSSLEKQATTDFLSGLSNRRQFQTLLESNLEARICVAVIDVDNFKSVNDRHGHLLGDTAIRFVAALLLHAFQDAICTARLGGEEFGVIVRFDDRQQIQNRFEAFRLRVAQTHFSDQQPTLTVSIGLAFSETRDRNGYTILHQADQALYESKKAGKNQVRVFDGPDRETIP